MIIRKRKTLVFLLILFNISPLISQPLTKKEFLKALREADLHYYYEQDYEKAAAEYEYLLNLYPDNSNLKAKAGICYLNIDGKKAEALKYLNQAALNIVENDKAYSEYGDKAPLDTYMYQAIAYHQNDSLQKAISLYNNAKKRLTNAEVFREEYIDNQIRDCLYAIEMKKKPLTINTNLFIPWLAEYPGACNPVLAKNDSVFIFTLKKEGKTTILCSYKKGTWKKPVDITKQLGGFERLYSNSITGNGKMLIIYMDDGGDGNLYYSVRKDSVWTKLKAVGKPINTIYWQSFGFITPDGNTMYFSSNRPGGEGELDIWYSRRNKNGAWGEPVNCGNVINTPYNEDTPFFDPETGALLFSSVGHISMGGYDEFRSINRNGAWTNPVGMPYGFNNTLDNNFFILNNNAPGFITSIYNEQNNTRNIYTIVAGDPASKITTARGTISLEDGMNVDPNQIQILLADLKKETPVKIIPLMDSSSFKFEVNPGDYQVFISQPGYKTDTINLNVPMYFSDNYISLKSSLVPEKVFEGDFLSIDNILFEFDSYKLEDGAIKDLELLKSILKNHPDLKVEVAGYTDSKGSNAYNHRLADKRAQTVIDFFISSGIPRSRFTKEAYGASNFTAVNTNRDGTDNPEGRRYNRRVSFGIVNPQTGVTIHKETYIPQHLMLPSSLKYSIILLKNTENLSPGYFRNLKMDEMLFIKSMKIDSVSLYILGLFYNRNDASVYLSYVKEKGFKEAYIVTQYEINEKSKSLIDPDAHSRPTTGDIIYTIQIKATKQPAGKNELKGIGKVREVITSDGYYRYIVGEYNTYLKAKEALNTYTESGFKDAFIRELNELINK